MQMTEEAALALNNLRRIETVLCRLRYLMAAVVLAMAVLFEPAHDLGALMLAAGPLAFNAYVYTVIRRVHTVEEARRLGRISLAVDSAGAAVTFLLFLGDPTAMPVAFMPFLAFELSIRYGTRGIVAGLALFALALAIRVYSQIYMIEGGAVRPPLLLLWSSVAILMVAFSREFRAEEEARLAALREREHIASGFRTVISQVLARSGVPADEASHRDVLEAVRRICEERSEAAHELAVRIADLLVTGSGNDLGLSRREREILSLLGRGFSYSRIAAALFVSPSTVRNHVHNIKTKLDARSREEIIELARKRGLAL